MQDAKIADGLETVKCRFLSALDQRLDILEANYPIPGLTTEGRAALKAIQAEAHKISGTAATLGYRSLGRLAADADQTIADFLAGAPARPGLEEMNELIDALIDEAFEIVDKVDMTPYETA